MYELAKEWEIDTRQLCARLEEIGIHGKKAQSALTDQEIALVWEVKSQPSLALVLGEEKLVAERAATETEREAVYEKRIHQNVIRRRIKRVEGPQGKEMPQREHFYSDIPKAELGEYLSANEENQAHTDDPYYQCNHRLSPHVRASFWDGEIAVVTSLLTDLPAPHTDEKSKQFEASGLTDTLLILAQRLKQRLPGRLSKVTEAEQLTKLLKMYQPFVAFFKRDNRYGDLILTAAALLARLGRGDLLAEVWPTGQAFGFSPRRLAWISLADAAAQVNRADLFAEAWQEYMATQPSFASEEHQIEFTNFINVAVKLSSLELLSKIFRDINSLRDPTVHRDWKSLYRPFLNASTSCQDELVRTEILETLRGQRLDLQKCFQVLRDVPPQRLDMKGDQFENACRCLMRYLVNSFFFKSESEFERDRQNVVQGILSLPADRSSAAWVRFLGRGQEAYKGALRALCAAKFREVTGIGFVPWEQMSPEQKSRIVEDITDRTTEGLVERIAHFIREFEEGDWIQFPSKPPDPDPISEQLIQYLADNYKGYLCKEPTVTL
ncbi:MAG: hypothetical protein ACRERD_16190, partial [Candidatus Binatia bacterium]